MKTNVKPSLRSGVAIAAMMKTGAGPHKDRRIPRGGAKNEERELENEYEEWRLDMQELDTRVSSSTGA
jgi:hypothetical protein